MKRALTLLLATIGLLAGISLSADYYHLVPGPEGTVVVDGMTFLDRTLADKVLEARNLDYDFRHSNGTRPRQPVVDGYLHLLVLDAADTPAAKARRATYALRLGEVYCWWRDEKNDRHGDYARAIDWYLKARDWAQHDQECVFWQAAAGLVSANLNQGRRIQAFFESVTLLAMVRRQTPADAFDARSATDQAKVGPVSALVHCGRHLSTGVIILALHRLADHADPVASEAVVTSRASLPACGHFVNPLDLPAFAFVVESPPPVQSNHSERN